MGIGELIYYRIESKVLTQTNPKTLRKLIYYRIESKPEPFP
ncbi:hypothetical protein J5U23_01732 [Saccharolobus shibatae B12]|uniref:Uncharacterized protein n=1 Tax=Saccharolobus shibatae (strain ATCC 51178 / DSM 5389 / JCM 8931 / NBRC 15437 / B12) TaxID=523848 RepID=A0A8F5BP35_SACSH|nr:hypothetical protein J5U23_01732 [Saccharolobus shibatae B12]